MSTMRPRPPQSQGLRAANHARDKDVEQVRRLLSAQKPTPKAPVATGSTLWATAESSSLTLPSGYPSFSAWTFFDDAIGLGETSDSAIFTVPPGIYMARVYVDISVSGGADFWLSANIFSASAYVTQEFPINLAGLSYHTASYTIGPLPVMNVEGGQMSVSFFSRSGTAPTVSGQCTYNLVKLG